MAQPLAEQLISLEIEGVEVHDSYLQQNVLVVAPLLLLMADNPRAAELLNHMGSSYHQNFLQNLQGIIIYISLHPIGMHQEYIRKSVQHT